MQFRPQPNNSYRFLIVQPGIDLNPKKPIPSMVFTNISMGSPVYSSEDVQNVATRTFFLEESYHCFKQEMNWISYQCKGPECPLCKTIYTEPISQELRMQYRQFTRYKTNIWLTNHPSNPIEIAGKLMQYRMPQNIWRYVIGSLTPTERGQTEFTLNTRKRGLYITSSIKSQILEEVPPGYPNIGEPLKPSFEYPGEEFYRILADKIKKQEQYYKAEAESRQRKERRKQETRRKQEREIRKQETKRIQERMIEEILKKEPAQQEKEIRKRMKPPELPTPGTRKIDL
jgi:hypothetical protein